MRKEIHLSIKDTCIQDVFFWDRKNKNHVCENHRCASHSLNLSSAPDKGVYLSHKEHRLNLAEEMRRYERKESQSVAF